MRRIDGSSAGVSSRRIVRLRPEGRLEGLCEGEGEVWVGLGVGVEAWGLGCWVGISELS